MTITEKILSGIKQAITEGGTVTIDLKEASAITGSGSGVGGRVVFDEAFAALRYANPFRLGARIIPAPGSDMQFVAKTGNATYQTNPWGYPVQNNTGTPNTDTSIWQLPVRVVTAQLPIRSAVMSDVNGLEATIVNDLMLEFAQVEGQSMATNDDQSSSTTDATGATSGLRGLDMYTSASTSAYGTSGTAITNGIHTISTVATTAATTYNNIVSMANALPAQYWSLPGTAWHMTPDMIQALRQLKDSQGLPLFLEIGDADGAAEGEIARPHHEDRLGVGRVDHVGPALRQRAVQLVGVREVEVAGDEQVAGRPDGLTGVGVAGDRVEVAGGAVAEVPEEEFAAEVEMTLHRFREFGDDDPFAHLVGVGLDLAGEDLGQALGADLTVTEEEGLAVLGADLDAADAGAVLAAVVLLLHQQEQLVEAVQRGAVLLLVPFQVLGQTDKGNAAFVP